MDKIIKSLVRWLFVEFCLVWIIAIATYMLGEMNIIPNGLYAAKGSQTEYYINMANVILIIICVPLSLKLFSLNTNRSLRRMNKEEALTSYHLWSAIRLLLLLMCVELGIVSYFLLMNSTGILCACIALVTTFVCIPSKEKVEGFLSSKEEEKEEEIISEENPEMK